MIRSALIGAMCGLPLLALAVAPAHAQIESGRAIDDSTEAPLAGTSIALQNAAAGEWKDVETTHTNAQGFFQFAPHAPGVYRVAFLGRKAPTFLGAPDTLAADSMQQREFRLPITRRGAASAYTQDEVEHFARAITSGPSSQPDPSTMHLASGRKAADLEFVVEADGTVNLSTLRVISTSDPDLVESSRRSLMTARYQPATIGGIPVRQIVQQKVRVETRVEVRRVR